MNPRGPTGTQVKILRIVGFIAIIYLMGMLGYMLIEDYTVLEAFYMTAITLTTTGFMEVRPLSDAGRVFTVFLLFLGVGFIAFVLGSSVEFLLGIMSGQFSRRRMLRTIEEMRDHIIICGHGRVGSSASAALRESGLNVVVIENNQSLAEAGRALELLIIEGDATDDATLRAAGIERAAGLLVTTGDDAVNLFIVLSARGLNPDLLIVARASNAANERKMRQAGANRVVSPHRIGGRHMANIIVRPHVTDFFDVVTLDNGQELWLEEFVLAETAVLCGMTIGEADIRKKTGVTIVAIIRHNAESTITPRADTRLLAGDQLIVLGTREQLAALENMTRSDEPNRSVTRRVMRSAGRR